MRVEATDRFAYARAVFQDSWAGKVDPDGELPEKERAIRAASARRDYYRELGRKSGEVRRKNRELLEELKALHG